MQLFTAIVLTTCCTVTARSCSESNAQIQQTRETQPIFSEILPVRSELDQPSFWEMPEVPTIEVPDEKNTNTVLLQEIR